MKSKIKQIKKISYVLILSLIYFSFLIFWHKWKWNMISCFNKFWHCMSKMILMSLLKLLLLLLLKVWIIFVMFNFLRKAQMLFISINICWGVKFLLMRERRFLKNLDLWLNVWKKLSLVWIKKGDKNSF